MFSVEQSRRVLAAGLRHGLALRLHADELVPSGGAQLAAEMGATSADHLAAPSREGIAALVDAAEAGSPVVATLLPATSLVLMKEHDAPARVLVDRGVPVALGSDFNPGTSPTPNLQLVLSLAVLRLKLTPSEALVAVTINAAHAVGPRPRATAPWRRVARRTSSSGTRLARVVALLARRGPGTRGGQGR